MRQFIFASGFGTDSGQVSYEALDANKGNLIFHRDAEKGGDILYPFHRNNFTCKVAHGKAATNFSATFECVESEGEQTIIFVKKGVKFNERNKWSVGVYVKDTTSGADIAAKLKDEFDQKPDLKDKFEVTVSGATLEIEATDLIKGEGWTILGADGQQDVKAEVTSEGLPGFLDAAYVKDLAAKCISELGYDSTYVDASVYLLPGSDNIGNPKDVAVEENALYSLLTLRFAEPRNVKTRDEVVNQIIQICIPKIEGSNYDDVSLDVDFDQFVDGFGQEP